MEDSCKKLLALKVVNNASAFMASPSASADEKVGDFRCALGVRRTGHLAQVRLATQSIRGGKKGSSESSDKSAGQETSGRAA